MPQIVMDPFLFRVLSAIFWLSVAAVFYSYAVFPLLLSWKAKGKKLKLAQYQRKDDLPRVSIIISAYNEQEVIEQKVTSIYDNLYPRDKMEVLIGSDASDDNTNPIVNRLSEQYENLNFFPYRQRRGKGNVINDLVHESTGDILVFTDANVMLDSHTIFQLARYFKDPSVGLVDTHMNNTNMHQSGISHQEKAYISREVGIKQHESILYGTMMGPFGGCFAVRKNLYEPVPKNFLVDDFYINMKVLEKGFKCINNLEALVFEDISNNIKDEFRRKVRISTGNFQNLRKFSNLLWHKTTGLSFCFISHKALRWLGPFFLLLALLTNAALAMNHTLYFYILLAHCFLFVLPLSDLLLQKAGVHIGLLRFITHFYSMNIALLKGFFKSLKKIESNVWKPTQRNQA